MINIFLHNLHSNMKKKPNGAKINKENIMQIIENFIFGN